MVLKARSASTPLNPDHQVTQYDVFRSTPRTKNTLTITPIPVEEKKLRRSSSLPDFTEQSREENPSLNNSGIDSRDVFELEFSGSSEPEL